MSESANIIIGKGKLPFVFLLEDSIDADGQPINSKVIELASNNGELLVGLFLKQQVKNDHRSINIHIEDINGELAYSEFLIIFERQATRNQSLNEFFFVDEKWDFEKIATFSSDLINKFIDAYKLIHKHKKDWIPYVTKNRLSPWSIHIFNKEKEKIAGINTLDFRGTGESLANRLSDVDLKQLKELSKRSGVSVDPALKFIQEANRYKLTGDYVSCIIFLAFSIEKWIFREVRYRLEEIGKTQDEIDNDLIKEDKRYIDRYEAIKIVTGNKNFKNMESFKNFEKNVTNLRDEIAHRDRIFISKDMVELAIDSTNKFRTDILPVIWNK
ncbi:MAG: hypothetical protein DSY77_02980 [Bacteroidetes bacterium]|nr:MAG: hypothetical protein DSY77_02980 [Bacteroidota bacterium]